MRFIVKLVCEEGMSLSFIKSNHSISGSGTVVELSPKSSLGQQLFLK